MPTQLENLASLNPKPETFGCQLYGSSLEELSGVQLDSAGGLGAGLKGF